MSAIYPEYFSIVSQRGNVLLLFFGSLDCNYSLPKFFNRPNKRNVLLRLFPCAASGSLTFFQSSPKGKTYCYPGRPKGPGTANPFQSSPKGETYCYVICGPDRRRKFQPSPKWKTYCYIGFRKVLPQHSPFNRSPKETYCYTVAGVSYW